MLAFDRFNTLDIDPTLYPKFTKSVEDEAREQTLRTIAYHLLDKSPITAIFLIHERHFSRQL